MTTDVLTLWPPPRDRKGFLKPRSCYAIIPSFPFSSAVAESMAVSGTCLRRLMTGLLKRPATAI